MANLEGIKHDLLLIITIVIFILFATGLVSEETPTLPIIFPP